MKGASGSREEISRQSLAVIREITRLLDRPPDPARTVRDILRLLSLMRGLNHGRVFMPDRAGTRLAIHHAYGFSRTGKTRDAVTYRRIADFVMRKGTIGLIIDTEREPMALIAVPILASGRIAGVLAVQRTERHQGGLDADIALLRVAASAIGQAMREAIPGERKNKPAMSADTATPRATTPRPYQWVHHDDAERIREALAYTRGNQAMAARMLNMSARQLRYRVRKLGIRVDRRRHADT